MKFEFSKLKFLAQLPEPAKGVEASLRSQQLFKTTEVILEISLKIS